MRMNLSSAVLAAALASSGALGQGLTAVPDSLRCELRTGSNAFDTVLLVNSGQTALRVDSITLRLLDGGANPKPGDFTACKACAPDSLGSYVYGGWLYGYAQNQSLRYLRDSLFLIQDIHGVPVTLDVGASASVPFALFFPVNCPFCGRPAAYPGAERYAFTFIASDGGRAGLTVRVDHATALTRRGANAARARSGPSRDAAGRLRPRAPAVLRFR